MINSFCILSCIVNCSLANASCLLDSSNCLVLRFTSMPNKLVHFIRIIIRTDIAAIVHPRSINIFEISTDSNAFTCDVIAVVGWNRTNSEFVCHSRNSLYTTYDSGRETILSKGFIAVGSCSIKSVATMCNPTFW